MEWSTFNTKGNNLRVLKEEQPKRYQNTCTARTPFPRIRVWSRYGTGRDSTTCPKNLDFAFELCSRWWCHVAREKPKNSKGKDDVTVILCLSLGMCRCLIGWLLTEWQIRVSWEVIWLDAKCFNFLKKKWELWILIMKWMRI